LIDFVDDCLLRAFEGPFYYFFKAAVGIYPMSSSSMS
jgi:hypothetical protein